MRRRSQRHAETKGWRVGIARYTTRTQATRFRNAAAFTTWTREHGELSAVSYPSARLAALPPRRRVIMGERTRRSNSASSTRRDTFGAKVCTLSATMLPRALSGCWPAAA